MTIDAAAAALATETALPEQVAETPTELTEDQALEAVWDQGNQEGEPESEPEQEEAEVDAIAEPETTETEGESDTAESVEPPPSGVPDAVKAHWKDIPPDARKAIEESQMGMSRKLAEQGRLVQGIAPIRDVLVNAARDIPALANMKPADVAQEVMTLAKLSGDFSSRPIETMMGLVQKHNLGDAMRQALGGQKPDQASMQGNQMAQKLAQMERRLAQYEDPDYLRGQVEQYSTETQVKHTVDQFTQTAEHWDKVEDHMPAAIQFVKSSLPNASPSDILAKAYELALSQFVPEATKAKPAPADEAKQAVDPERIKAALKAKSTNVKSQPTGKPRKLSEDEELSAVFDRMKA